MSQDSKSTINWMYEGPQSIVNREDYLTGRKIDRNFDLYNSDFKEEQSIVDTLAKKSRRSSDVNKEPKTSVLLDLETIKKEDPLVAIKVKEEQVRREILENPLKLKRLHSIVMDAMEKKFKKMVNKKSSPTKRRKSHQESSSDDEEGKQYRPKRRKSEEKLRESYSERRKSKSPISRPVPLKKNRHDSSSDSDSDRNRSKSKKSSEYGLVYLKNSSKPSTSHQKSFHHEKPGYSNRRSPPPGQKTPVDRSIVKQTTNNKPKKKLTEEEMEEKRREMMSNAKWREEQRRKNQDSYKKLEVEEEKRNNDRSKPVDFIRPMLSHVVDKSSVEERIKSKKHSIQRRSNAMDSHFARK